MPHSGEVNIKGTQAIYIVLLPFLVGDGDHQVHDYRNPKWQIHPRYAAMAGPSQRGITRDAVSRRI
jgi:hypothetical protein